MGTDDEQRIAMFFDDVQREIEPVEHIFKDRVGMWLACIENDIRKDRNDLFEPRGFLQKRLVESFHIRPEPDAGHRKVTLEAFDEIGIEFDILFIDEVHRLGRAVEEILYPAMEDFALDIVIGKGPAAKNVRLNLPRFTVVGATTRLSLLAAPLRDRFGARFRMDFYDQPSMEFILNRAATMLKVEMKSEGTSEIARRSRGTPRVALRLLRRVRDYAQTRADGIITGKVAGEALSLMDIDHLGLDDTDRRILSTIIEKFNGGPVGLDTVAAATSEDPATIMDVYEPYLLQLGFLDRTPRGRTATRHAYEHMGIPYNRDGDQNGNDPQQPPLF